VCEREREREREREMNQIRKVTNKTRRESTYIKQVVLCMTPKDVRHLAHDIGYYTSKVLL